MASRTAHLTSRRRRRSWLDGQNLLSPAVAIIAACVTVGCRPPATVVEGVVTLDGLPVANAIVQFMPERRDAKTAVAVTDAEGHYQLPVAAVPFRVAITAQKVVGQMKNNSFPDGPVEDIKEEVLPSRYRDAATSPLRADPAKNSRTVVNFPLSSKP